MRARLVLFAVAFLLVASAVAAQFGRGRFGYPVTWATADSFDGSFIFCRIYFNSTNPFGDGGNWQVDYPRADINFSFRLAELTKTPVSRDVRGEIRHVVVRFNDPELHRCGFAMMTEPGRMQLDASEVAGLKDYLAKGGFLWIDDFWGERAWYAFSEEMAKVVPPSEHPIEDVPLSHVLFHALYDVRSVPQIPSIGSWAGLGGGTSERGAESAVPHVRAIFDDRRHIMVLITHNTDFGDAFERETDDHEYFLRFAPEGYAFAVNALMYAMTH